MASSHAGEDIVRRTDIGTQRGSLVTAAWVAVVRTVVGLLMLSASSITRTASNAAPLSAKPASDASDSGANNGLGSFTSAGATTSSPYSLAQSLKLLYSSPALPGHNGDVWAVAFSP